MADFAQTTIEVRYDTNLWGPYKFSFPICSTTSSNDGAIPYGDTISSVSIRAFLGNVKASSVLANETEITDLIIDSEFTPTIASGYIVSCKFQYPGDVYKGQKITLIFEVTLTSGGVHPFYFQYLKVM